MANKTSTTKKTHRYNFGRLRIFIVIGVLIYVLAFMVNHQGDVAAQAKRQSELLQTQTELEQQVQYYTNELDYIGTDEYVEQEARNRFGWLKNGEIKYMEGAASSSAPEETSEEQGTTATADPSNAYAEPDNGNDDVANDGALSD